MDFTWDDCWWTTPVRLADDGWGTHEVVRPLSGPSRNEFEPGGLPPAAPEDLRPLIRLETVNVHQIAAGGMPYVGFESEARWDEEHGLGVLMNGTRVVEVGGADSAVLPWIAEEGRDRVRGGQAHG